VSDGSGAGDGWTRSFARYVLTELAAEGVQVADGLSDDELAAVEQAIGAPVPLDVATLFRVGLPVWGPDRAWIDWRSAPAASAKWGRDWVRAAFTHDVELNRYWHRSWGPRPDDVAEAIALAVERVDAGPPLMPLFGHRFITTAPAEGGHPVLSVYQATDTIVYGHDLADYLHHEFSITRPEWAASTTRPIPFWGELFGLD
jgi:hypothetical protein